MWRPRFSLRLLLVAIAMIGVALWLYLPTYKERRAIQRIIELEGDVFPDDRRGYGQVVRFALEGDVDFRAATHIRDVTVVSANGSAVTDDDLLLLAEAPTLRYLFIPHMPFTDRGMEVLRHLPDLEQLVAVNTRISDESLKYIATLSNLWELHLAVTDVSNEGVARLVALKNLRILDLASTRITDDALSHIGGITTLENLGLGMTNITRNGLARLHGLGKLEHLTLDGCPLSKDDLDALGELVRKTNIGTLSLNHTVFTEADAVWLESQVDREFGVWIDDRVSPARGAQQ